MKRIVWFLLLLVWAAGCAQAPGVTEEVALRPTTTPPPTATPFVTSEPTPVQVDPRALLSFRGDFFATSGICAECHTGSVSEAGANISIDSWWRASMMANSARDPYWQAELARMAALEGTVPGDVEALCADCHTPMAAYTARQMGRSPELLDNGALSGSHPDHSLAMDGVSCTICHQITDADLGFPRSYSGGYQIESQTAAEGRPAFGSFDPSAQDRAAMQAATGFVPFQAQHLQRSEYCATCHTLYTPVYTVNGPTGDLFPAQTPYFEWFYSEYRNTTSCQDCHMPVVEGSARLTNLDTPLRIPFSQHSFIGGNTYILSLLDANPDDLSATASLQHFRQAYDAMKAQLQNRTAVITMEESSIVDTWMRLDLLVENLSGHKFPTGHASRRAWIHLSVTDSNGDLVFESGAYEPSGLIIGDAFDETGVSYEPHYSQITRGDQVQIYETITTDSAGEVTTAMLYAAGRPKDNRLLPAGFSMNRRFADFAIYGDASDDDDFLGGEDRIRYLFDTRGYSEPFTVQAELLFLPVGYRWIADLQGLDEELVDRFLGYVEQIPPQPQVISAFSAEVVK